MLSTNKVVFYTPLKIDLKILKKKNLINTIYKNKIIYTNTIILNRSFNLNIKYLNLSHKIQQDNFLLYKSYLNKKTKKNLWNFFNKNKILYIQISTVFFLFKFFKSSNFLSEVIFNDWWQANLNRNYFLVYQSLFLNFSFNNQNIVTCFSFFFYRHLRKRYDSTLYFLDFQKPIFKIDPNMKLLECVTTKQINDITPVSITPRLDNLYTYVNSSISGYIYINNLNNVKKQLMFNYWSYLKELLTLKKIKQNKKKVKFHFYNYCFYFFKITKGCIKFTFLTKINITKYTNIKLNLVKINFLTCAIWLQTVFIKQPKLRRSSQRRLKYFFLVDSFVRQIYKRRTSFKLKQLLSIINLSLIVVKFLFVQNFFYIFTTLKYLNSTPQLKLKLFLLKWVLRRKKYKRHYYRGRFFFFKKRFKKAMGRRFKKNSFFKKFIKLKQFLGLKNTLLKTYKNTRKFNKYVLTIFSFKFLLIYTLLLSPQFRRYLPSLSKLLGKIKINFLKNHFNFQISTTYKWSSITPFFYLPLNTKKLIRKETSKPVKESYLVYLRQYFGGFFESLLKRKVFLKITTKLKIKKKIKNIFLYLYNKHRNYQYSIGRGFFLQEMLFVCWYSFFSKDLSFLMTWLTRLMGKIDYKKHRKLLKILKSILLRYKYFFLLLNKVEGFKFGIKGKLGVKGNAKKRIMEFTVRNTSFSKKKNRIEYQQGLVYTETGVLGVTMVLAF